MQTPFEIFFSYAPEDEDWQQKIEKHLGLYQRQNLISGWSIYRALAGTDKASELERHLKTAPIIVLLISPYFVSSDECWKAHLPQALEREKAGSAHVLPVLARPLPGWQEAPFAYLQILPRDEMPLSSSPNEDETLAGIANEIGRVIKELQQKRVIRQAASMEGNTRQETLFTEPAWNIPLPPNPFFTGREAILVQLRTALQEGRRAVLSQSVAVSGLGGVGKTQTAVEYAYRYRGDYQAICWVQASTTEELAEDFAGLARLLNLPEQREQERAWTITVVKRWFERHERWLLIFDNADELERLYDYLPRGKGHVLITTRAQATGEIAQKIDIPTMEHEGEEDGLRLLLRRAGLIAHDAALEDVAEEEKQTAREIICELGGLPLALDQAGAYIEETGESLAGYLLLFREQRAELLSRRGGIHPDHPPVATTWNLALKRIEAANPTAIELIRLCAFLAPDAIPEELLSEAIQLPDQEQLSQAGIQARLNDTLALLLKYSLVQRDGATKTVSIHRLVQAVIQDEMNRTQQRRWAEKMVRIVAQVFPFDETPPWSESQRYLPHALLAVEYSEQWRLTFAEVRRHLGKLGSYFHSRGQYSEAEPLLQRALTIAEKRAEPNQLEMATRLNSLAILYSEQGQFEQAESLFLRALAIREQRLGDDHIYTATCLDNLASLYFDQDKFEMAEPLYLRALSILEQRLGHDRPETAGTLNNLALLYVKHGKGERARPLLQRALAIYEQRFGRDHPETAITLNTFADLCMLEGDYEQAEPLYLRALAIFEQRLGPDHPKIAHNLADLAMLYTKQGKVELAEPLFRRALVIYEQRLGEDHPETKKVRQESQEFLRARDEGVE